MKAEGSDTSAICGVVHFMYLLTTGVGLQSPALSNLLAPISSQATSLHDISSTLSTRFYFATSTSGISLPA